MGNHSCVSSFAGDESRPSRRHTQASQRTQPDLLIQKSHRLTPAVANDSLDKLYKKILQPYQSKAIHFSRITTCETQHSSHDISMPSIDASERLSTDLKLTTDALPMNIGNSIFVFRHETDPSILKAIITGPDHTPYAHGLFEFDIFLPDSMNIYPRVQFCTTGENTVNFGLNLPASGVVDMASLVAADPTVFTDPSGNFDVSSLLLSLQTLLRTGHMSHGDTERVETPEGKREYKAYCNTIKYATVQYAMLNYLINPPPELREFVEAYFCLKKDLIHKECKKWLAEAQLDNGIYDGMAMRSNNEIAQELRNGAYFVRLHEVVQDMEKQVGTLRLNEDSQTNESMRRRHAKDSIAAQTF